MRVLCVAEKPSIAKAVANHLSGGQVQTHSTSIQWIKNYNFNYNFGPPWNDCDVTMTCVAGHIMAHEFGPDYQKWDFPPPDALFDAPISKRIAENSKGIAKNIRDQAKYCQALVIWTDCDREGEHIGSEIESVASAANKKIQVKRAHFSNVEPTHIRQAAPLRKLKPLDQRQVDAVDARIELDLRIGYAFSRFLCNTLKPMGPPLDDKILSYGSCQFPTLGFVVDRYFRVKNFVPEPFWGIKMAHKKDDVTATFSWARGHLFERLPTMILYERCINAKVAIITNVQEKETRKYKPLPLTTVELQKAATRILKMTGQQAMTVAEKLYTSGFISYPRTETDKFDRGMDLKSLIQRQVQDSRWGPYASSLMDGGFSQPREGKHDDKAHPPIHPVNYAAPKALSYDEARLYEYVVRRFLACCSEDALGTSTDVEAIYGHEVFRAHGLNVKKRNYLDVYPYENWTSSAQMPSYTVGERFEPTKAEMTEGKTAPPKYLTEADLIALMDANGIGTDATMAEHIDKIQKREYVAVVSSSGAIVSSSGSSATSTARGGRGGRGGRAGGRAGRAETNGRAASGGDRYFIPTRLGMALIEGFDRMDFETSLGKPFLRKEMELQMKDICAGKTGKTAVLKQNIQQYRQVYMKSKEEANTLKSVSKTSLTLES
ncbi:hypothetical protein TD95_003715 [Thielaviopsis punctulata]|uniref:DNA topoisomerase n=1 Tax=Thielaviopsis punctulata TaxID=72032 RepID=A0A0F4ZCB9_9PEZI|nr:hypothetical protein TD95_003715 [Thielaviopsis punctulata]